MLECWNPLRFYVVILQRMSWNLESIRPHPPFTIFTILQGPTSIQLEQYGRVDQHGRIRGARPRTESCRNGAFRRQRSLPLHLKPLEFLAFRCGILIFLAVDFGRGFMRRRARWHPGGGVLGEIAVGSWNTCFSRVFSAVRFPHVLLTRSHSDGVL